MRKPARRAANNHKGITLSLKVNILANYTGHVYVTVLNLVMVPLYLRYMGVEAYGLVGFFAMLQLWFQLLDIGLTPTMSREAARFLGGATDLLSLRRLLRALECIFVASALMGAAIIIGSADAIATHWLKAQSLPLAEVRHALMLMALLIALRWIAGLYRGAISGLEQQVWLNGFNMTVATVRSVLVLPLFLWVGSTPTHFFAFQLIIAVVETGWLVHQCYRLLPLNPGSGRLRWEWAPLRGVLKFSLSVAFTSSVWVMITQTDKLVLSRLLPLAEYGYFTLAVLVAGGVMLISGPISAALQPRITSVAASGDQAGVIRIYRKCTQLVTLLCVPAALLLAFFPAEVLWTWTGNAEIAQQAAPVLVLYAIGNGVVAVSAMPYFLQFAKGNMRLHVIGGAFLAVLLIPALVWSSQKYGALGAGYTWLCANVTYFLTWVPLIHRHFLHRLHLRWLSTDIGFITLPPLIGAFLLHALVPLPKARLPLGIVLACLGILLLLLAAAGSSCVRELCRAKWGWADFSIIKEG